MIPLESTDEISIKNMSRESVFQNSCKSFTIAIHSAWIACLITHSIIDHHFENQLKRMAGVSTQKSNPVESQVQGNKRFYYQLLLSTDFHVQPQSLLQLLQMEKIPSVLCWLVVPSLLLLLQLLLLLFIAKSFVK